MILKSICCSTFLALFPCIPAASADPLHFTDVTDSSGVTFLHRTGAQGGWHYIETMGSGCALFDYDNDGDLDLYLVNGANLPDQPPEGTNALYRNDGKRHLTAKNAKSAKKNAEKIEEKEEKSLTTHHSPLTTRSGEAEGGIVFTEVTQQAGVPGRGYGMGCVATDYDNDGDTDLYVTGFEENILYRNNGDGAFTDVTRQAGVAVEGWSSGATFFDYDGDGCLDLFVVRYLTYDIAREPVCERGIVRTYCPPNRFRGAPDILFRNDGDSTFTDVTQQAGIIASPGKGLGVLTLDYDNDGDTDLYVANDTTPNFLYRNNGDSTFTEVGVEAGVAADASGRFNSSMGVDAGDIDGDGFPDLIATNFSYETNVLYRNQGNGLFVDATEAVGLSGPSFMPLGFGGHFFDFDNDGDLDLFVANGQIFPNVARFSAAESYAQPLQLFQNDGGAFADISDQAGFGVPTVGRGSAVGDLDGDGDLDLVVSISGGRPRIYRNDVGSRKHWLMVKLKGGPHPPPNPTTQPVAPMRSRPLPSLPMGEGGGNKGLSPATGEGEGLLSHSPTLPLSHSVFSNRDGIGARVSVTAGGRTQAREVRSQSSYLSTSDVQLHFGLGAADRIERIEVRWPDGRTQILQDIRADQTLVIEER